MEKRTVYLHIGQTKTATTTLQAFFYANRAWLATKGVLYPAAPEGYPVVRKHRFLVDGLRARNKVDFDRCAAQWAHLRREIKAVPTPKVLVSEEVLWHLFEEQEALREKAMRWMAAQLDGFEVKIICYLRRQDRWVESYHNQIMKTDVSDRSTLGVEEFAGRYSAQGWLDYCARLDEWAAVFGEGNVIVRPFERGQFVAGDIIKDFCDLLGIADMSGAVIPDDKQVSLSNVACELSHCFNKAAEAESCKREFLQVLRDFDVGRKDERHYLPAEVARRLLAECGESNRKTAEKYLGVSGRSLFTEPENHDSKLDYPGLSVKELAEFTLHLYAAQQAKIEELQALLEQRVAGAAEAGECRVRSLTVQGR